VIFAVAEIPIRIETNLADGLVTNCLPPWFPNVGVVLYFADLGLSFSCRAARILASASTVVTTRKDFNVTHEASPRF
jgi:hypothetical protein